MLTSTSDGDTPPFLGLDESARVWVDTFATATWEADPVCVAADTTPVAPFAGHCNPPALCSRRIDGRRWQDVHGVRLSVLSTAGLGGEVASQLTWDLRTTWSSGVEDVAIQ